MIVPANGLPSLESAKDTFSYSTNTTEWAPDIIVPRRNSLPRIESGSNSDKNTYIRSRITSELEIVSSDGIKAGTCNLQA